MHHLVEAEGGMSLELHQFERRIEVLKEIVQVLLRQLDLFIHSKVAEKTAGDIPSLRKEVQRFEIELITAALLRTGGSQLKAARLLGVKLSTLNAKIKRYGITTTFLAKSSRDAAG
jgi:transcriptional regulator with GAF, ATPase, and Fis domain